MHQSVPRKVPSRSLPRQESPHAQNRPDVTALPSLPLPHARRVRQGLTAHVHELSESGKWRKVWHVQNYDGPDRWLLGQFDLGAGNFDIVFWRTTAAWPPWTTSRFWTGSVRIRVRVVLVVVVVVVAFCCLLFVCLLSLLLFAVVDCCCLCCCCYCLLLTLFVVAVCCCCLLLLLLGCAAVCCNMNANDDDGDDDDNDDDNDGAFYSGCDTGDVYDWFV